MVCAGFLTVSVYGCGDPRLADSTGTESSTVGTLAAPSLAGPTPTTATRSSVVDPLVSLPALLNMAGDGVPSVDIALPQGYVETALVHSRVSASQGEGVALSSQSYGLTKPSGESVIVTVTRGEGLGAQLLSDVTSIAATALAEVRAETVYSWHDQDTGQDGLAWAVDEQTVVWIFSRDLPAKTTTAIAAALKVGT